MKSDTFEYMRQRAANLVRTCMRLLISLILLVMIAGCSKSTADCQHVCEHLIKLGKADIEASIASMGPEFADTTRK